MIPTLGWLGRALVAMTTLGVGLAPSVARANDAADGATDHASSAYVHTVGGDDVAVGGALSAIERRADTALALEAQIIAGVRSTHTDAEDFPEFVLDRAELGTTFSSGFFRSELQLESLRSTSPQSVFGIDGDSILIRVRTAWGAGRWEVGPGAIEARLGLIPDSWRELLEQPYNLRGVSATLSERAGYFAASDLGGAVLWDAWQRRVQLSVQFANGEATNQPERNRGKNTLVAGSFSPLATLVRQGELRLSLLGGWQRGTEGFANGRNHRVATALALETPWIDAGAEYVRGWGWQARPDIVSDAVGVYANGALGTRWVGLAVRHDRVNTDLAIEEATTQRTAVALYSDLIAPTLVAADADAAGEAFGNIVRLYVGVEFDRVGAASGPLPGVPAAADATRVMLLLHAHGVRSFRFSNP